MGTLTGAITAPFQTLVAICAADLGLIPFSLWNYTKVKRLRRAAGTGAASA
jgi:hypothetical protein